MRTCFFRRSLPALAAVAVLGLLVPVNDAGAASTPTCLGRKATYVGTDKADQVHVEFEYDQDGEVIMRPPVLVLRGGDDNVHVHQSVGIAYICGGTGDDNVHVYDGGGFRFYGDKGEDFLDYQPRCPGGTGDGRTFDVEETLHQVCTRG